MVVKTPFTEDDFKQILINYELGKFDHAQPVSQGTVQTNYFIQTTQGKYVFRYYENRSKESVLSEIHLLGFLIDHQFPCPKPCMNNQGIRVGEYREKPYVIYEYIDGQPVEIQTTYHKQQLIQLAAELQKITRNYQPKHQGYRWNYDISTCKKLAGVAAQSINTDDAYRKLSWLENQLFLLDLPESVPKGICHCDFHYSNVLFKGDKLVGLIDFDDANFTYLMFDLVCLIDWEWPRHTITLDFELARPIAKEYMSWRRLSEIEQRHTFDVHKLCILFDCIWFFERGLSNDFREKRKMEFLNNLGRNEYTTRLFLT